MNISKDDLFQAGRASGLGDPQVETLWMHLHSVDQAKPKARFDTVHVLYYMGALIVIGAMGWFMNNAWESFGGEGIFIIASAYAAIFLVCGLLFWRRGTLRTPSGLLVTIGVCMVPLAIYGIERWTGFWSKEDPGNYTRFHPYINGSWLIMETATIIVGVIALCFCRFAFLTAPIAYALWFMSMDLADFCVKGSYSDRADITMYFGLAMILAAYVMDLRSRMVDLAFWGYIFGVMTFWGGLTDHNSTSEYAKLIYCLINCAMVVISLVLNRRVFSVFGAIGIFIYLWHLADVLFKDSLAFPFILSAVGLAVIVAGVIMQKNHMRIRAWFVKHIQPSIRSAIPPSAMIE